MNHPAVRDAALLFIRVIVGFIFVAHGYSMIFLAGPTVTTNQFTGYGIPAAGVMVWVAAVGQMLAGAALVVGLLTSIAAGCLILVPAAAIYYVHGTNGLFVAQGGMEYTMLLMVVLLTIVIFGPGRASIDGVIGE